MDTSMFDFSSMQMLDNFGYNLPVLDPLFFHFRLIFWV